MSPEEERKSLETKLKAEKVAVVVLIDELDRIDDQEVRAVAQLIKAVGDIKGISYLVAYDPRRVAQALGRGSDLVERRPDGEAYLEKIVQFAVPLRPLFEEDARALLKAALRDNDASLPTAESNYQTKILDDLIRMVRTPREIKRLVGAFAVLEQVVHGEICPYDVLGYSWLITKAPAVRDAIARDFEVMVDDPGVREMNRRMVVFATKNREQETLADLLGDAAAPQESMLRLLFPRFGGGDASDDGNRIAKRRNLVRLLYLGDPPGMMHRAEIERLWCIDSVTHSVQAIQPLLAAERITLLLDRLPDLLSQLPPEYDATFWPALARSLIRAHDWITGEEALGSLVSEASQTLWRFGSSNENNAKRVRGIFDELIADGDLLIAPSLLRRHLLLHNLTSERSSGGGRPIFSKTQTEDYFELEHPRYARAMTDGTFLKRLPDTAVLYSMLNMRRWTDDLRTSFGGQLDHVDAIATFAALTVRPSYVSDKATMNEIMDGEYVLSRMVEIAKDGLLPTNLWLRISMKRLAATLRGHDPTFICDNADDSYIQEGYSSSQDQRGAY